MSVTGKAEETLLIKTIASRQGKFGVWTRKKNEINNLLEAGKSKETVIKHVEAFNNYLGEFMELQVAVQNLLSSEEEKEADYMDWYEPELIHFQDFLFDIKSWLPGDVEKEKDKNEVGEEQEEASALLVGLEDSVSQTKKPASKAPSKAASSSSSSSHASTACLKARAAEQAALKAKAQALEVKHALNMEEVQLKARRENMTWRRNWLQQKPN